MKKSTIKYNRFDEAIAVNTFVSKAMLSKTANAKLSALENALSDSVRDVCNQSILGEDFNLDGTGMEYNVVNSENFRGAVRAIMREAGLGFELSKADMDTLTTQFASILIKASQKDGNIVFEDKKRANAKDEYVLPVSVRKCLHACIFAHLHDKQWMTLAEDHSRKAAKRARERARKAEREEARKAKEAEEAKQKEELERKLAMLAKYQELFGEI